MRLVLAVALVLVVAPGCGSTPEPPDAREPGTSEPGIVEGPPSWPDGPAPKLEGDGPPPAWIETGAGSFWLGYSTYCWRTTCADYIAPSCARPETPELVVGRDAKVTFHLGFDPKEAVVMFFLDGGTTTTRETQLEPEREPVWVADRGGPFALRAISLEGGDASYAGCIRFEGESSSSGIPAPEPGGALTIEQALAFGAGEPVLVKGVVIAPEGEPPRLCNIMTASYPPICGEPSLVLRGLDLRTVKGVLTVSGVSFTENEVTFVGTVHGKVLALRTTSA
jgi:hypothetical protein